MGSALFKYEIIFSPGRISGAQNNSGLRGTWSWNSSNFHSDDVMDSSYTDPDFVPMYSLDGIDDVIVAVRVVVITHVWFHFSVVNESGKWQSHLTLVVARSPNKLQYMERD